MFRTTTMAALALALMSSAAFAQSAPNGPPAQLSGSNPDTYQYDDRDGAPPAYAQGQRAPDQRAQNQQDQNSRDMFCRRDAAARTGYVSPGEAARHEQTSGSIGGAVVGAALGAVIGGASGNAGAGALIGGGTGLIAGTAIGANNARRASRDVERDYSDAYYACMGEADDRSQRDFAYDRPDDRDYAYYGPPPTVYYAPYPYYARPYYGPSLSFGFGFGGGWGGGRHGGFRHH